MPKKPDVLPDPTDAQVFVHKEAVEDFASEMVQRLNASVWRGHWSALNVLDVMVGAHNALIELRSAEVSKDAVRICKAAADLGNYAMFMHDTFKRQIPCETPPWPGTTLPPEDP